MHMDFFFRSGITYRYIGPTTDAVKTVESLLIQLLIDIHYTADVILGSLKTLQTILL